MGGWGVEEDRWWGGLTGRGRAGGGGVWVGVEVEWGRLGEWGLREVGESVSGGGAVYSVCAWP